MVISCEIIDRCGVGAHTYFELYRMSSKNKNYYKVLGGGAYADSWDSGSGFYEILSKDSKTDVISNFKDACNEVFTNHSEFDYDELDENGSSISFEYI